jgi:hypothetical protein
MHIAKKEKRMKKRNSSIVFAFAVVLSIPGAAMAHSGKTTAIMKELAIFHNSLFTAPAKKISASRLVGLLRAGGDSKRSTAIFKSAIPLAQKLEQAGTSKDRLNQYALLVEKLAVLHGFHDESGTFVFYCPMVKRKWIANEKKVRNPYDIKMKGCGSIVHK